MQRSTLIRNVYAELRQTVGNRLSPRETLEQAVALVDLVTDQDDGPDFDDYEGRLPFSNQDLDLAMADGGWRVLSYETNRAYELGEPTDWIYEPNYDNS